MVPGVHAGIAGGAGIHPGAGYSQDGQPVPSPIIDEDGSLIIPTGAVFEGDVTVRGEINREPASGDSTAEVMADATETRTPDDATNAATANDTDGSRQ